MDQSYKPKAQDEGVCCAPGRSEAGGELQWGMKEKTACTGTQGEGSGEG